MLRSHYVAGGIAAVLVPYATYQKKKSPRIEALKKRYSLLDVADGSVNRDDALIEEVSDGTIY